MAGYKETKEMVGFVLSLGNALGKSAEDGKVDWTDLGNFVTPLTEAGAAFGDANLIAGELKDLDESEAQELKDYVVEKFDIPQDELEAKIELALDIGIRVLKLVALLRKQDEPVQAPAEVK